MTGIKKFFTIAAAMAMMGGMGVELPPSMRYGYNEKPYPKPKSLPKYRVGENFIHAKDAKTAIKYAKKRGLWKEGMIVKKIEELNDGNNSDTVQD